MSEIIIQGDDLQNAAHHFRNVSEDLMSSMQKLDDAMVSLERNWSGATQQVFYHKYKDVHLAMEGMSSLLKGIANEMVIMAERMSKIDTEDRYQG